MYLLQFMHNPLLTVLLGSIQFSLNYTFLFTSYSSHFFSPTFEFSCPLLPQLFPVSSFSNFSCCLSQPTQCFWGGWSLQVIPMDTHPMPVSTGAGVPPKVTPSPSGSPTWTSRTVKTVKMILWRSVSSSWVKGLGLWSAVKFLTCCWVSCYVNNTFKIKRKKVYLWSTFHMLHIQNLNLDLRIMLQSKMNFWICDEQLTCCLLIVLIDSIPGTVCKCGGTLNGSCDLTLSVRTNIRTVADKLCYNW